MTRPPLLLAIDQGTTSSRAILFDTDLRPLASARRALPQSFPKPGLVEHDPQTILEDTITVCRQVLKKSSQTASQVVSLGITNQRETVVLWDRQTGHALHPALVWQDRRTTDVCDQYRKDGLEDEVRQRTGLLIDPYFSASKIAWLLDHIPGARNAAEKGQLAVGTIDCWLLWHLSGRQVHATDPSNASRTLLFNLTSMQWDPWLCQQFRVPPSILPQIHPTCSDFGTTDPTVLGYTIPIGALIGDQQAATLGQGCFQADSMKCTFGTGAFAMQNTGSQCLVASQGLLTTLLWHSPAGVQYALEGSIFSAGSALQWLRDKLGLFSHVDETEALARQAKPHAGVHLVPAFTGLGAPWWNPKARAALTGLSRGTGKAEIVRAALEATCFQTRDLLETAQADGATPPTELRVDGGMCNNAWFLQFLADTLAIPILCPSNLETTAAGAALCAGLQSGILNQSHIEKCLRTTATTFHPKMCATERDSRYALWQRAVARTLNST